MDIILLTELVPASANLPLPRQSDYDANFPLRLDWEYGQLSEVNQRGISQQILFTAMVYCKTFLCT